MNSPQASAEIEEGFELLNRGVSKLCEDFKREFKPVQSRDAVVRIDNRISRTLLTSWVIDILALLSTLGPTRFEQIRKELLGISGKELSRKLTFLEKKKLVTRKVYGSKPPTVEYRLSTQGQIAAHLEEPLMLYLRYLENPN